MHSKLMSGICALLIAISVNAQLYIKNSTDLPISVCVGWYSESSSSYTGYVTKGWYNIDPGNTVDPGMSFTSDNDYFFYYAKSDDGGVWEGEHKMLVNDEAFTIKNADKQYVKDKNPSYEWKLFRRKDVQFKTSIFFPERIHTLNLTSDETKSTAVSTKYFEYKSDGFNATIKLEDRGNNDYYMEYDGMNFMACGVLFESEGVYSNDTSNIIFKEAECKMTFRITAEGNLSLLSTENDCYFGPSCSPVVGTYTRKR